MTLFEFSRFDGSQPFQPQSADRVFDQLADLLMHHGELMLQQLQDIDEEHPEVVEQLIRRGYLERDRQGRIAVMPRGLRRIENKALEALFLTRRADIAGRHATPHRGPGETMLDETRPYRFGDPVSRLNLTETLRNALRHHRGPPPVRISYDDLAVFESEYQTNCATVVLLDMSGSMNRFGKYAAAKRVALALQALVRGRYREDSLQFVGFYSYASPLSERALLLSAPKPVSIFDPRVHLRIPLDAPDRFVPQHFTNIHAGLMFARRLLLRSPARNKQIIVITDGEPTAHVEGQELVLIYPPSERTARATLREARRCAQQGIHIAAFALVEDYFYLGLVNFVQQLAHVAGGVAAYCDADDLGNLVVESFIGGRHRRRAL